MASTLVTIASKQPEGSRTTELPLLEEDRDLLQSLIKAHEAYPVLPNTKLATHKAHCVNTYPIDLVTGWIKEAYLEAHTGSRH